MEAIPNEGLYTPEELGQTCGFLTWLAKPVVCIDGKKCLKEIRTLPES